MDLYVQKTSESKRTSVCVKLHPVLSPCMDRHLYSCVKSITQNKKVIFVDAHII